MGTRRGLVSFDCLRIFAHMIVAKWIASLFALCLMAASAIAEPIWYLNTNGIAKKYTISRFVGGNPDPVSPVIWPSGSGFDSTHIAWPTAVDINGGVWVYATGYDGGKWGAVGLWKSLDGKNFTRHGPVLTAGVGEPYGIGMSHILYDPEDTSAPFKMWFSIRSARGPATAIGYATSADGESFTRRGTAMPASESTESTGITVDNVCQMANGDWALFYTAFPNINQASARIATASSPAGPFSGKQTIFDPDGTVVSILTGALRRSTVLSVASPSEVNVGQSFVIIDGPQEEVEVVTVEWIEGDIIRLTAPLSYNQSGRTMASLQRNKISPSWAAENPDGTWRGIFTSFGHSPSIMSEYTFPVKADSLNGPWVLDLDAVSPAHEPWAPQMWYSTENPSLLRGGVSCGV